jgi:hypothetical protein
MEPETLAVVGLMHPQEARVRPGRGIGCGEDRPA